MPRPAQRTRSRKRVTAKLPGGRSNTHYRKEIGPSPKCALCGKPLHGIPRTALRKRSASRRRVERPFGGHYCPICLKKQLQKQASGLKSL